MHPQLELLLELQDLKAQKEEMETEASEGSSSEIEREVFQVKLDDAAARLQRKIEEMEKALDPTIANRYRLVASRRARAVVPVLDGVCYGCFMSIPTEITADNSAVRWCENCGSFLYVVDSRRGLD